MQRLATTVTRTVKSIKSVPGTGFGTGFPKKLATTVACTVIITRFVWAGQIHGVE